MKYLVNQTQNIFCKVVFDAPDLNILSLSRSFCDFVFLRVSLLPLILICCHWFAISVNLFFKVIFDATNPCAADHRHRPHPLLLDGLPGGRTAAQGK